jgi:PilZ domain
VSRTMDKQSNPVRQHRRIPYPPDLVVSYEGFEGQIRVYSPNISPHGMFINTPSPLPQGAVLTISFRLPLVNFNFTARSEVRYCLPGVGVGVEFVEITDEARSAIEREIAEMSKEIEAAAR